MRKSSRRGRDEIAGEILSTVVSGENLRTRIMYRCNLSFEMTNSYTDALIEAGLMTVDNNNTYHVTPEGESLLKKYREFKVVVEPFHCCLEKQRSI